MPDQIDMAQEREIATREAAVARARQSCVAAPSENMGRVVSTTRPARPRRGAVPASHERRGAATLRCRACLDCAQPIPAKRLKVCPWAIRCVDCQEANEKGKAA